MTTINTAKAENRRTLHFERLEDILDDVDRLVHAKEVKQLGNWTPGQILKHLAVMMTRSIDGFRGQPPWILRCAFSLMRPFMKNKFLRDPMPSGFKLPSFAAAELLPPATNFDEGVSAIRQAIHRLQTETTRVPSPLLGQLTVDQWNQLHCRHAELHLSFLTPGD